MNIWCGWSDLTVEVTYTAGEEQRHQTMEMDFWTFNFLVLTSWIHASGRTYRSNWTLTFDVHCALNHTRFCVQHSRLFTFLNPVSKTVLFIIKQTARSILQWRHQKSSRLYSTASPMKSQSSQNCILSILKKLLLSWPPPSPIKISKSLANKTAYMKEVKLHQPLTGTSKKPNPFKPLWKRTALICVCLII